MTAVDVRPPSVQLNGRTYPLTLSTEEAAEFFDCSAQRLRAERDSGTLPVKPLTLGHRLRWPTLAVAQAVGLPAELVYPDA